MWLGCFAAVVALNGSWIPVDQFVGGPPRVVRGSDAAILALAAALPTVLHPRLSSWERINPHPTVRVLKVFLGLGATLATALLVWIDHTWIVPAASWRPAAVNAVSMSALAQLGSALAGPALVAPGCISLYWAAVAVEQHEPGSGHLLSVLAAAPPHTVPLPAAAALVVASAICTATTLGRSRRSTLQDRNRA